MPRTLDPMLAMMLDRANPNVCHFAEVTAPDVGVVLRRAADQFLAAPYLVSQTPANAINADPAGALTLASVAATFVTFPVTDDGSVALPKSDPTKSLRGLAWRVDRSFGRAVLRSFTATIRRKAGSGVPTDLALQIYRASVDVDITGTLFSRTFVPLLESPAIWRNEESKWSTNIASATFELGQQRLEVGTVHGRSEIFTIPSEEAIYYFVIEPFNASADDLFYWFRDTSTSRTVANVGNFDDRRWHRDRTEDARTWQLDTYGAVPVATIQIEQYVPTAQVVYALTMPTAPIGSSVGRVVFERGLPAGTAATLELSTAGSGGPWTAVTHGDVVTTKQATYHLRLTLTASANQRLAPRVAALGLEFRIPYDVTAEATVDPIAQEIAVPFLQASIGEGRVTVVRTGRRDYRDPGSDLAALYPTSKLEVDLFLGSRHPLVTRDRWLHLDRALVNNREPTAGAEQFGLLSYLKTLKRKIPESAETINETRVVTSASTLAVTVSQALPDWDGGDGYNGTGRYMRVRASSQTGVGTGFVRTIAGSPGDHTIEFDFNNPLPGTLIAGDVIEIHSASFLQEGILWEDEDPAAIWWQILTVHRLIPTERIGRGDLGRASRSGLPPTVADRAPGDLDTQAKLRVTFKTQGAESADELIDQLSFLMGGATVDIGGQIVFRQIYPLRDATGGVVVAPEPVAAVFDARNTSALGTPTAVEQRISKLSCNYGVDTSAVSKNTPAALTTVFADIDAMAWLDDQPLDELAPQTIPEAIARWCFNSADSGLYLASMLTQQVVRAASTGLRVWPWRTMEQRPELVVGDRVTVITDQYTDYDPARRLPIRGWYAFTLCLVAVADGGRQFRGYMLGLTDAVQIRGGAGTLAEDTSALSSEILAVTFKDSVDGTTRTYDVVAGGAVATLFVHHRLWPTGTQGDPFDFSQVQHAHDDPQLLIVRPDPADGHFRFTLNHPVRGFQRVALLVPRRGAPSLAFGDDVWKLILDPAPPAASAKIHAIVANDKADLEIAVTAGVSDWPVLVEVFENDPDGAPLVSTTITAPTTLTKIGFPALGTRQLPLRELKYWWAKLTNVALEEFWAGPESANRDPLPQGTVTLDHYRADPVFRMVFDTDTDKIRVTIPDGRTKTFDRALGQLDTSPVLHAPGVTLLDDLSTEDALAVDEARQPYKVEYQGGGVWVTMFGPSGVLRGFPSNPPTARVRVVKNATGSTEDIFVLPDSSVPEKLRVYFRDGESALSPVYGLVVSAGDSTPLYVVAGTEIGPANFFKNIDGTGSPSAKLSGITLTRDQIKRVSIQIEGQDSLVRSPWLPVALSLLEKPWNESFELVWDDVNGELIATVVPGARCLFETCQVADNETFTSPTTRTDNTVADGVPEIFTFALSAAQRGKLWYGRVKANNLASNAGLDSEYQTASVFVPALFDVQPSTAETATTGTLTLVVDDPGGVLDPTWTNGVITGALHFEVLRNGVKTTEAATSVPGGGATTGTYTKAVTLLDHPIQINAYAHLVDGSVRPLGSWMFDSNKISDVVNATVANSGVTSTVSVNFDSDTLVGSNCARYSINGGAFTTITVSAGQIAAFNVTRISTKQTVLIQGKNAIDGNWGNSTTVEVDAYIADGPSLDIRTVVADVSAQFFWSGVGTITVSINGGSFGTPASSPITVNRSASVEQTYEFKAVQAGQTVSRLVTIPSNPMLPQGTIGVSANGATSVTVDGPGNAASFRYLMSTSSFPLDATVASSGTNINSRTNSFAGTTLTFGQTLYVTVVFFTQFSGAGAQLTSIHLQQSFTTYSGSKTQYYSSADWDSLIVPTDLVFDTAHNAALNTGLPAGFSALFGRTLLVPSGVTITSIVVNAWWGTTNNPPGTFSISVARRTGSSSTGLGSVSPSQIASWVAPSISVSELVSAGNSYEVTVTLSSVGAAPTAVGTAAVGDIRVSYNYSAPDKTL